MKHIARSKDASKSLAIRVLKNKKSMTWMLKGMGKIIHIHTKFEFPCHCPTLLSLMASAADSQSGRRNRETMIVCILAKFCCSKLALIQKMISAILFSAYTGTSVSINVI